MNFNQPISLVSRERTNKQRTMIKPEDLRIGDFVKVSSDHSMIPQGTICEVVGISCERILTKKKRFAILLPLDRKEDEEAHGIWLDNIEGIPITKEFLVKNGFKEVKRNIEEGHERYYYDYEISSVEVEVRYYPTQKKYVGTYIGIELCGISFVHELQNILSALKEDIEITV